MITGRKRVLLGALAILVMELITVGATIAASHHQEGRTSLNALGIALLAIPPLVLPLRLRWPLQVLAFTLACMLAYSWIGFPGGPIYLAVGTAYFTVHRRGMRGWAAASLVVGYIGIVWVPVLLSTPGDDTVTVGGALGVLAWLLVLFAIGEIVRTRARFVEEHERSREEERQRQISDERLRIARELHDVLAHNVSLINVQAGVALHLIDERPEQAREALTNIKAASAETLREMRSVLGVLRGVDEEAPRSPAPSLARLDSLVASASAAGLDVTTSVEGSVSALPAGVDLAAYRIVQEALTNVARHAGHSAHARVLVGYGSDALTVQVDDDGAGAAPVVESPGSGTGLVGMRERVTALGGSLEARPRPGGGFRVRAVLPLDGVTP
jgi:signal transduction histidine kinase